MTLDREVLLHTLSLVCTACSWMPTVEDESPQS